MPTCLWATPIQTSGEDRTAPAYFPRDKAPGCRAQCVRGIGHAYPEPGTDYFHNLLGMHPLHPGLLLPKSPAGLCSALGKFSFTRNAEGGINPYLSLCGQSLASLGWRLRSLV